MKHEEFHGPRLHLLSIEVPTPACVFQKRLWQRPGSLRGGGEDTRSFVGKEGADVDRGIQATPHGDISIAEPHKGLPSEWTLLTSQASLWGIWRMGVLVSGLLQACSVMAQ